MTKKTLIRLSDLSGLFDNLCEEDGEFDYDGTLSEHASFIWFKILDMINK